MVTRVLEHPHSYIIITKLLVLRVVARVSCYHREEKQTSGRDYIIWLSTLSKSLIHFDLCMKEHSWLVTRNILKRRYSSIHTPLSKRDYEPHSLSVYCVTSNQIKRRKGFLSFRQYLVLMQKKINKKSDVSNFESLYTNVDPRLPLCLANVT